MRIFLALQLLLANTAFANETPDKFGAKGVGIVCATFGGMLVLVQVPLMTLERPHKGANHITGIQTQPNLSGLRGGAKDLGLVLPSFALLEVGVAILALDSKLGKKQKIGTLLFVPAAALGVDAAMRNASLLKAGPTFFEPSLFPDRASHVAAVNRYDKNQLAVGLEVMTAVGVGLIATILVLAPKGEGDKLAVSATPTFNLATGMRGGQLNLSF